MSGSMSNYMYKTVEQLLTLVHFAPQINVPFRVYGFTNILTRDERSWEAMRQEDQVIHDQRGAY